MKDLTIIIKPGILIINKVSVFDVVTKQTLVDIIGKPSRIHELKRSRGFKRSVLYYDILGVYAIEDNDDKKVACISVNFDPKKASFPTVAPFNGDLYLNEILLEKSIEKERFPASGEINFVSGIGNTLKYWRDHGYVEANFSRNKYSGKNILSSVTYSFIDP